MRTRHVILFSFFTIATSFVLSWLYIWSFSDFRPLTISGFPKQDITVIPTFVRSLYKGFPSIIILFSYILYTLTAFIALKEKQSKFKVISALSFAMIAFLLLFLL